MAGRKSANDRRWEPYPTPPEAFFDQINGHSRLVASIAYQAGVRDAVELTNFLATEPRAGGLHDPLLLRGMRQAVERINQAIDGQQAMAVYGDYDADGITAVALLVQALRAMGADITPYIPHRIREGYGLNLTAVDSLADAGIGLLITVDCGITNHAEVAHARSRGIDVIVTDHHDPPAELPPALAIINPKQPGCRYPFKGLVGVGIAYKLVQALIRGGRSATGLRGRDLLDVVALGTVADMGPLRDENRVLVRAGIQALRTSARPGVRALIGASKCTAEHIRASDIGFQLGPMINAAGRIDDPALAYELLLADDPALAAHHARRLRELNDGRKASTEAHVRQAAEQLASGGGLAQALLFVEDAAIPPGIVGLVAGRLCEAHQRPAIVVARGDGHSSGSARAPEGYNMIAALRTCHDWFMRYGGHAGAAGFTIATERLGSFAARMQQHARDTLGTTIREPVTYYHAELAPAAWTISTLDELALLEPHGQGNPTPAFISRGITATNIEATADGKHLRFRVPRPGGGTTAAIAFGLGHLAESLRRAPTVDLLYELADSRWNQTRNAELVVRDFRRATALRERA
jgi:single-stranded-DNA-specific exonuclease